MTASNSGVGSYSGNPSGDVRFVLAHHTWANVTVTATTCAPSTALDTALRLYDGCPSVSGSHLLAAQSPDFYW